MPPEMVKNGWNISKIASFARVMQWFDPHFGGGNNVSKPFIR
jgi:hypothetical protein